MQKWFATGKCKSFYPELSHLVDNQFQGIRIQLLLASVQLLQSESRHITVYAPQIAPVGYYKNAEQWPAVTIFKATSSFELEHLSGYSKQPDKIQSSKQL
jgi:hypothetical protein